MRLAKAAPRETWTGAVYPEKGRTLYDFGPGAPVVNLELLRDVLEALPGARAVWTGEKSPIVFDTDNGRGLLLPVLPQGNAVRTRPVPAETEPETTESTESRAQEERRELTPQEFLERIGSTMEPDAMTPEQFAAMVAA